MDEISNLSEACERMSGKIFRSGDGKENEPYERRNPAFGSPPNTGAADEIDRAASTANGFVANISCPISFTAVLFESGACGPLVYAILARIRNCLGVTPTIRLK